MNLYLKLLVAFSFYVAPIASASESQGGETVSEAAYIAEFNEHFHASANSPADLDQIASAARYDELYMGASLNGALTKIDNENGGIAWGLSYRMMSLNEMFRATKDRKYLEANRQLITAIFEARDDKRGLALTSGGVAPVWGAMGYKPGERAAFVVHTAMVLQPTYDYLNLARAAGIEGDAEKKIAGLAAESFAWHGRSWREGPGPDEAHYIGLGEEPSIEGKPQPLNRFGVMGVAMLEAAHYTGDAKLRERAFKLGRYAKARMAMRANGAWTWSYMLPEQPGPQDAEALPAEDISHGALSAALPLALFEEGEVFTRDDMLALAKTVTLAFARRTDGILFADVSGSTKMPAKYVQIPARWLSFAEFDPEVYTRIAEYYRRYRTTPAPLEIAMLLRWRK